MAIKYFLIEQSSAVDLNIEVETKLNGNGFKLHGSPFVSRYQYYDDGDKVEELRYYQAVTKEVK